MGTVADTNENSQLQVHLRAVFKDDLSVLFSFQSEPEANQMVMARPRTREQFDAHWTKILSDSSVLARSVLLSDSLVGCINCFAIEDVQYVGYWIGKQYWGQGIATRALRLLLQEVSTRPLQARVAISNVASMRVLQKCGFQVIERCHSPGDERFLACEEAILELRGVARG